MENINIALPIQSWQIVVNALVQRPFSEVNELIGEIKRQAHAAMATTTVESHGVAETHEG